MGKWLVVGFRQKIYKMNLEQHPIVQKGESAPKQKVGSMSRGHMNQPKGVFSGQSDKTNNVVLNYKPKYNVNIQGSILRK